MSGALAERAFAAKFHKAGFEDVSIGEHTPYGIDHAARYPLFTEDLIDLMRRVIPEDRQDRVAVSVIVRARKP